MRCRVIRSNVPVFSRSLLSPSYSLEMEESDSTEMSVKNKSKATSVIGHGGPKGCEMSRLPHFLDNWLTDGGEVVGPTCQEATIYPPGRFLVLIFVRGWVNPRAIVWLEVLHQLKNPVTSSGIIPTTFQLLAYCLNQVCYRMPRNVSNSSQILWHHISQDSK
jgi:hypothetical protein